MQNNPSAPLTSSHGLPKYGATIFGHYVTQHSVTKYFFICDLHQRLWNLSGILNGQNLALFHHLQFQYFHYQCSVALWTLSAFLERPDTIKKNCNALTQCFHSLYRSEASLLNCVGAGKVRSISALSISASSGSSGSVTSEFWSSAKCSVFCWCSELLLVRFLHVGFLPPRVYRTVPPFVTAHMLCTSRNTSIFDTLREIARLK